jgi:hypothetical protein
MLVLPPPKSNGMMTQPSRARPEAAPRRIRSSPSPTGPLWPVPIVRYVTMPGLLASMIFNASTTR